MTLWYFLQVSIVPGMVSVGVAPLPSSVVVLGLLVVVDDFVSPETPTHT
jgi:hypothetical protein